MGATDLRKDIFCSQISHGTLFVRWMCVSLSRTFSYFHIRLRERMCHNMISRLKLLLFLIFFVSVSVCRALCLESKGECKRARLDFASRDIGSRFRGMSEQHRGRDKVASAILIVVEVQEFDGDSQASLVGHSGQPL